MTHPFITISCTLFVVLSCGHTPEINSQETQHQLSSQLYEQHAVYEAKLVSHRRFKHSDIVPFIQNLSEPFDVRQAGQSVEGRAIYHCSWGKGDVPILLWSQMHGDEPTATMALLDIFNFLSAGNDGFDSIRQELSQQVTLHFIPLLNPDGAEVYQRRNALGIDLNRDALRLQTPEARLLKHIRDSLQAAWGFNLHDQNRYYAAGETRRPASMSFLAPAYNYAKETNEKRADAMRLIVMLNDWLQVYIPDHVARYDDAFEPRAFGDNMQLWGTRTILIESGGLANDLEKQELRRLHFMVLLSAFNAIAHGDYQQVATERYGTIPMNNSGGYFDLLLREVTLEREGQKFVVDLGFRRVEYTSRKAEQDFVARGRLADIGDLSTHAAYQEVDGQGYRVVPGQLYPNVLNGVEAVRSLDLNQLMRDGYTDFAISRRPTLLDQQRVPVALVRSGQSVDNAVAYGKNPSLLLKRDGRVHYAVINGALHDLR